MHTYEIMGHQYEPTDTAISEGDVVINTNTGKWGVVVSILDTIAQVKRNETVRPVNVVNLLHVERIEDDEVEDDNDREDLEDEGDVVVDGDDEPAGWGIRDEYPTLPKYKKIDDPVCEKDGTRVQRILPSGKYREYVVIHNMLVRPDKVAYVQARLKNKAYNEEHIIVDDEY